MSLGRFQGARQLGCAGSSQLCEPRPETVAPKPVTKGIAFEGSDGVQEKAFPAESTAVQ